MSDKIQNEEQKSQNLAGHPPAMKVGGMRVSQPRVNHEERQSPPREGSHFVHPGKTSPNEVVTVVSGAPVKLKEAFPEEATKAIHEQKMATHDEATTGHKVNKPLGQPRRFYH
ncbi:death-associated protein 1-like [Artemia franciscana]|uniref:Death-associated protein 1 n=1 Tax=Artemia franciscana TaxID=6661 RepID=A0AA88I8M5_ARTSF|nr:hypothetical protein QYM36_000628 [Artemia franciscana]